MTANNSNSNLEIPTVCYQLIEKVSVTKTVTE